MTLLQMTMAGSILILAVLLIRILFINRLPKGLFPLLWGMAVLRLLIPVRTPMPEMITAEPVMERLFAAVPPVISETVTAGDAAAADPLLILWSIGAGLIALYFLAAIVIAGKRFRDGELLDNDRIQAHLCGIRRKVRVKISDNITAPLSYGIIRPVILLPRGMEQGERTDYVLCHELAHIRRYDQLAKGLTVMALILHWFDPLVWVMFLLYNRDMELAADEAVLRADGYTRRRDYALTLIDLQEQSALPSFSTHFSKSAIEERIAAIMKSKQITPLQRTAAILLVLAAAVIFAAAAPAVNAESAPLPAEEKETIVHYAEETLVWPTQSRTLSLTFGDRTHPITGEVLHYDYIIIVCSEGDPVVAASSGTVTEAGFDTAQGNYLVITDGDNRSTAYGHLKEVTAALGDAVSAGDIIGTAGQTGTVTGPCLSFGIMEDGIPQDPMEYFE